MQFKVLPAGRGTGIGASGTSGLTSRPIGLCLGQNRQPFRTPRGGPVPLNQAISDGSSRPQSVARDSHVECPLITLAAEWTLQSGRSALRPLSSFIDAASMPDSGGSFIERSATQLHVPTRSKLVRAEFVGKKTGRHAPPRPCAPGGALSPWVQKLTIAVSATVRGAPTV